MFIAHGEKFRKNARWIMAGVLLLIIPSFIALFTTTSNSERNAERNLPTIAGKPVNANEYQESRNAVHQLIIINTGREPSRSAEVDDRVTQEAVVRMLILRKAKEMGIRVSDGELIQAIQSQPILLNEAGQFDPERYRRFTIYMNNLGISEGRYEQLMREQITRARLEQLITSAATATPAEVDLTYAPLHERLTIEMAQFNTDDYKQPVTVSNKEAQAFYEQNKESFRIPAQTKVRYAKFSTDDAKKTIKLTDEEVTEFFERNKARYVGTNSVPLELKDVKADVEKDLLTLRADRAAGDRATEFSVRIVPKAGATRPDFATTTTEFGVQPTTTEFFSQLDKPLGVTGSVAFVQQAFALTPETPTSDPIPGPDGYYVIEYLDSNPSVVPAFEEVKDKVVDQIKRMRIYDATVRHGQETVAELKKLMASGKSFADAAAQLKLKVETPPAFVVSEEKLKLPSAQRIQTESVGMSVGDTSEFIPTSTGGLVFHLKDRRPPDPAAAEKDKPKWAQRILQQNRQALFEQWVGNMIREQQVTFGRLRTQPVQTEPTDAEPLPQQSS